ncbi:MAG: hypothetical protein HY606_06585 [Planctomycetes bacterium]|nr:hypothetical protein [Planctomycetota bacterium]
MSLLGLDIGTTGCKAIVFNEGGQVLSCAYREYSLSHPRPGWVEISPHLIWDKVSEILREVNSKVRRDPVKAVSISCQGEAVLPISENGEELYNFIITFDSRTQPQCDWWRQNMGAKKIFSITGMPLHPMYSINKIMWLKENEHEIFQKTWKFLCVEDYIIYRLSSETATDYSLAARTMAFDVVKREWSNKILEKAGIERRLLPSVYPSGTAVGKVTEEVAKETGFNNRVIAATGGHDQPCGALGAGIVSPGMAMNATGTSDVICPAFPKPILNEDMLKFNYCCYPHTCEDYYCSIAFNLTGGLLLRWYRDTLCYEEREKAMKTGQDPYEIILSEMSDEPQDLFILPHFVGAGTPYLDPNSRGVILGLTLETKKPHLARAVIDSINYEMNVNIDRMEEAGIEIKELRAIGGGAKSKKWLQMKADVFDKPVVSLKVSEAASLGTAILAGKASGIFKSTQEAVDRLIKIEKVYEPDASEHNQYQEKYQRYLKIYDLLREFNREISIKSGTIVKG